MRSGEAVSLGRVIAARRRGVGAVKTWELGGVRRRAGGGVEVFELPAERLVQLAEVFGCTPAEILDASMVSDEVDSAPWGGGIRIGALSGAVINES